LNRRPSHRFDSKIAGRLWLDDFRLEKDQSMTKAKVSENKQVDTLDLD